MGVTRGKNMIKSMTGFSSKEARVGPWGKVVIDIRSTNHKFLEVTVRLPEGLSSLEEKIKKEIESRLNRGRIICSVLFLENNLNRVVFNRELLKKYLESLKVIKKSFAIEGKLSLDAVVQLPGVFSLVQEPLGKKDIWPRLRLLLVQTLDGLLKARIREGEVLARYLDKTNKSLLQDLATLKSKFKKAVREKMAELSTEEEKSNFLKNVDISEELERLQFHIRNFKRKLYSLQPVGKELDFIAQEMQREINTIGAKSCAVAISGKVVEMKSKIEKIREQVQNIE